MHLYLGPCILILDTKIIRVIRCENIISNMLYPIQDLTSRNDWRVHAIWERNGGNSNKTMTIVSDVVGK